MNPQIELLKTQIVKKAQVSDTIYHTIREGIAAGLLPMGTRLREEDLAEVFDVSRTPVREAMKKLEIEQLVESNSVNGSVVRRLSVDECLDTLEVLELLRNAACNVLMGRVPRSFLMVLEQNTRKGMHLTDSAQCYENNSEFHNLLIKATGNSVLAKLNDQLSFSERMINNTILPVSYQPDYAEHHRRMLKAIVDSNMEALQVELNHSRDRVERYMRLVVGVFLDANEE